MTSADADRGRREDPDTATFTASRDCIRPDFLSALPASGRTCHLRLRHIGRSIGYETGTRAFEESKVFWCKDMTLHWINARSSKGTLYKFLRDQVVDTPKVIVVNLTIVRHTQLGVQHQETASLWVHFDGMMIPTGNPTACMNT